MDELQSLAEGYLSSAGFNLSDVRPGYLVATNFGLRTTFRTRSTGPPLQQGRPA
jgi:hypothetical protein